jgi:hypothetical protein
MKRYLTLLTLSFLSTSTLVNAGKIDIFDLPKDPEERKLSLTAKAARLQQNIDGTQDEILIEAFNIQRRVITNLLNNPLAEQNYDGYFGAQEQIKEIKANFLKKVHNREFDSQFDKIERILRSGIYTYESQEFNDLQMAMQNIGTLYSDYNRESEQLKGAARYLKMEKVVNRHIQKADSIMADIMAEAELRRNSNLLEELEEIQKTLPYRSEDEDLVWTALRSMRAIQESRDERDIIQAVLEYRALKEKLEPFLLKHRNLKQETSHFVHSILTGHYTELEKGLSNLRFEYGTPEHRDVNDFLRFIGQVKELPGLLSRFKELEPKVGALLSAGPRLGDPSAQPGTSAPPFQLLGANDDFLMPGDYIHVIPEFNPLQLAFPLQIDEAPRENIATSVFKLNSDFEIIPGKLSPKGYQFVADPEQKARKHGPIAVVQKYPGHAKVAGDGYVLYSELPSAEMKKLHGERFRFQVEMKSTTPGAYIQYWGFKKGSEKLKSTPHPGNGAWQTLSIDFTIDQEDTKHFIYPVIQPAAPSSAEAPIVKVRDVRITRL